MYDSTAIETINFEQLVTATDRLLFCGRPSKRRISSRNISTRNFVVHLAPQPRPLPELTMIVKRPRTAAFGPKSAAVIAALSSITLVLVSLL
jgi:hypothetical protein